MAATPTRDRVKPEQINTTPLRRPEWIKVRAPSGETYQQLHQLMRVKELHTVCEEAMCPNMGECWGSGTATFLMLGDVCTRSCVFCDIKHGKPGPLDWLEPERVAQAVKSMKLKHAVITSVNRDERRDGGAPIFAMVIRRIRELHRGCSIEVLIPDFKGSLEALKIVMEARPEILNHNVETVPRLFKQIQPQDNYAWAAATLSNAKKLDPEVLTKSGIMVGLGEEIDEVKAVMRDQRAWGVDILTIGQYLQPSKKHYPISRYYTLEEFKELKEYGLSIGFKWVESASLVRSSYHAGEQVRALSAVHRKLYGETGV
ncbi:MAG: lipoyl synthase [Chloroflexi bacterium GWB2_49_20]|nr:MAG: lipoyl synthase [Chloroflexi bacterium GWB2_49_20]OGN79394.1 MAG: lipoyl synthase [Chloroflexi bacterium GWC2_49_37]OGN82836.1 MAG: lipoyl synthase [Chloroflexi bacterium GWD2_49_16]HCC78486.1 lipoyl synthase [Anaerolineae bacterium]HCM97311.1 lipoyl synthase [Anaerolineae bacterium]